MRSITAADRTSLIKLASGLPQGDETRKAILAGLAKVGTEFSSKEEMEKYRKEHPKADMSKHKVVEGKGEKKESLKSVHGKKEKEHRGKAEEARKGGRHEEAKHHEEAANAHEQASNTRGWSAKKVKENSDKANNMSEFLE